MSITDNTYFNTHFNLSFGVPRTDTCARCDELNVALGDTKDAEQVHMLQQEKQEHLRKAQDKAVSTFLSMCKTTASGKYVSGTHTDQVQ